MDRGHITRFDARRVQAIRRQQQRRELERMLDPDTAGAEGAVGTIEQPLGGSIVEIHIELIGKHEFHFAAYF